MKKHMTKTVSTLAQHTFLEKDMNIEKENIEYEIKQIVAGIIMVFNYFFRIKSP